MIKCSLCDKFTHPACVPDWEGVSATENAAFERPGIVYYCIECRPLMKNFAYAPDLDHKIEENNTKIEALIAMVAESLDNTRTYAQAVKTNNENGEAVIRETKKLEETVRQQSANISREQRKCNAVIYLVEEHQNDAQALYHIFQDLHMNPSNLLGNVRLGKKKDEGSCRPLKIKFPSEAIKSDFMSRYNSSPNKGATYIKHDLTKEQLDKEFQLRTKRRKLQEDNTGKSFKIRDGIIYDTTESKWIPVEIESG